MRVGIIGAGRVGRSLGRRWAKCAHRVIFGVREPDAPKHRGLARGLDGSAIGTVDAAARRSAVVLLAVPWSNAREAVDAAGDLSGKIVIDCMNPLTPDLSDLDVAGADSTAETVARWAPGASVVKSFNICEAGILSEPDFGGERCTMFLCGDSAGAKSRVARLGEDLGFEMVDAGPLEVAGLLESLALLMISLARGGSLGPEIALRLLRRDPSRAEEADGDGTRPADAADPSVRRRMP